MKGVVMNTKKPISPLCFWRDFIKWGKYSYVCILIKCKYAKYMIKYTNIKAIPIFLISQEIWGVLSRVLDKEQIHMIIIFLFSEWQNTSYKLLCRNSHGIQSFYFLAIRQKSLKILNFKFWNFDTSLYTLIFKNDIRKQFRWYEL